MATTTWTYQLGDALSEARVAAGNVLLDWNYPAHDNLVLRYKFDEASYNGTPNEVVDSGPNALHGVRSGDATTADGWLDRSLDLSGADGARHIYRDTNAALDATKAMIVWARHSGIPTNTTGTISERRSSPGTAAWYFRLDKATNYFLFVEFGGVLGVARSIGTDWVEGEWNELYLAWNGTTLYWACNGIMRSTASTRQASAGSANLYVGARYSPSFRYPWAGYMDDFRLLSAVPYTENYSPKRYPDTGYWQVAAGRAEAGILPGVLTVTLAEALPAGTGLEAKLLGTADTGWQTLSGSGTSYTYDFTGAAGGEYYPAVRLAAGGTLNANTPTVTQAELAWSPFSTGGFPPGLLYRRILSPLGVIP